MLDTDLVSTMVYSRHYYGDCPPWIEEEAARRLADLYLLHHVDVEWVADGRQREQPERREELFERFRATLAGLGARVADSRAVGRASPPGGPGIDRLLAEPAGSPLNRGPGPPERGAAWTSGSGPNWCVRSRSSWTTVAANGRDGGGRGRDQQPPAAAGGRDPDGERRPGRSREPSGRASRARAWPRTAALGLAPE